MGGGLVAVGQVLRGMQRAGGEGWTAVVCGCVDGEGRCGVACVCCLVPSAAQLHSAAGAGVCWGVKNRTVKGFNVLGCVEPNMGVEMKMELNPKSV